MGVKDEDIVLGIKYENRKVEKGKTKKKSPLKFKKNQRSQGKASDSDEETD